MAQQPVAARRLGSHGPLVSPLGFGAFKIGRNQKTKYSASYDLPDQPEVTALLNGLLDSGITYFDTAPAYGLSEERIGIALSHRRKEFTLSTKVGETFENGESTYDFSRAKIEASVRRSLQRLKTDTLDLVFIHSPGDDLAILNQTDAVPTLMRLRDSGAVKAIGLSGKSPAGALAAIEWADAIMVEYHLQDRSHQAAMTAAAAAGLGVVVKKGLSAGALPAEEAIHFVLAQPSVSTLIVGSLHLDHMQSNLAIARAAIQI
jgi:aryl-alcohol dehydrogenase-like predicted oxidoreductase